VAIGMDEVTAACVAIAVGMPLVAVAAGMHEVDEKNAELMAMGTPADIAGIAVGGAPMQ
jgi:hypothetical protein|tara:strand:- start:625 stop:801 length:177 start_codon:yes stop_codon:yes gene_type:complete